MRAHPDCSGIGHCGDGVCSSFLPTEEEILQPDARTLGIHRKATQKLVGWTMPGVGNDAAGGTRREEWAVRILCVFRSSRPVLRSLVSELAALDLSAVVFAFAGFDGASVFD